MDQPLGAALAQGAVSQSHEAGVDHQEQAEVGAEAVAEAEAGLI